MGSGDGWDRVASRYRWQEPLEAAGWRVAMAQAAPRPGDVVVDVGCGPGLLRRRMRALPYPPRRVVGVDASAAMLARARDHGEAGVRADVTGVPLADGCADLVVAGWVLHVLGPAQRRDAVAELARLLAPGGRAVVLVPAAPRPGAGTVVRAVAQHTLGSLTPPLDLDHAVAAAGLVTRVDVRVGGGLGYATRVLLLHRARP